MNTAHTELQEKISLRLFMGCHLTSEWKMHTNLSSAWKEMQILPKDQREFFTVHHNGKEYIAFFIKDSALTLKEIEKYTVEFRQKMGKIFPKQDTSKVPVFIFAQLFIA